MEAITVSKLNNYIKQIFDAEELLHNIPVVGEIFGVSVSRNVIYFSLKDESSMLSCVCFYPNFLPLLNEGDKVIVTGSPNYYIKGGKLNFNVIKVEKVGQGQLYENFLKLKITLEKEGLFDSAHKKPLPKKIERIGVITSRDGAVIQDIKNIAWRRNPTVDIVLYNTRVQGKGAENEIAHAIDVMGKYPNIDVIIVARGGGSLEDLWAYNTEIVARSTYNCPKPIISAVGHETDFTIIDFVSDLRAPTPSAAAELLTFNIDDRRAEIAGIEQVLKRAISKFIELKKNEVQRLSYSFLNSVDRKISICQNNNINNRNLFIQTIERFLNQKNYELGLAETTISKINPLKILSMGFAKIEQDGKSINTLKQFDYDKDFNVAFIDGKLSAKAIKNKGE